MPATNSSVALALWGELFRGRLSRRQLLARGAQLGLSAAALGALARSPLVAAAEQGKPGGKLSIALRRDFETLDPGVNSDASDGIFLMAVFDRLVERTPDGKLYPGLAQSWSVSPDGLAWTFKLRQGVKFHDGTPFNAAAVKANFDHIADPKTKSEYAVFELGPYAGTDIVDDYTVNVKMTRKYGPLLAGLATYGMGMSSPAAIKQYGANLGQHPVGTGPYRFKEWVQKSHATVVVNPDYNWASGREAHNGRAYLDEITFDIIPEDATRLAALKSNQVQMASNVPPADWKKLADGGKFTTEKILQEGYPPAGAFINVTKFPTDDLKVRQALIYAVNPDEINQVVYEGVAAPANGIISTFAWAYDKDSAIYSYDPDKANALLDEAGWKMEGGVRKKAGKELQLVYLTLTTVKDAAEVVQAQLQNVGVNVSILAEDNPAQQADAQAGKHNLVWTQWEGVDPADLHKIFGSENIGTGWNFAHYSNPQVDKWFDEGEAETDQEKRRAIYNQIQQTIMQDAAFIPYNNVTNLWGFAAGLAGTNVIDELGSAPQIYDIYWNKP